MKHYQHLTEAERLKIYEWRILGVSVTECAKRLDRNKGTLSRELKRDSTDVGYLPDYARNRYEDRRKHCCPKQKLDNQHLRGTVLLQLEKGWSPELIAGRLRWKYKQTIVNHETIYKFIYDSELGKEHRLYEYLPRGKKRRTNRQGRKTQKSTVPNRIFIDDRPPEVNERNTIGHWETDSLLYGHQKAVNTTTERLSRVTLLTKLSGRGAQATADAITRRLATLPVASITGDNGPENAEHEKVSSTLNAPFFFCHPYHSWEKGSVENRNGVVRRYLPRGTDLDTVSQEELDDIAREINNRPMKCLDFRTPLEVLSAHLVALRN
jgi:transposase, IS30 family